MGKSLGVREIVLIFSLGVVALLVMATQSPFPLAENSVELGVVAYSPNGASGGGVVPASCPSYAHIAGECTPTFTGTDQTPGGGGSGSSITILSGSTVKLAWSCINSASSSGSNFSTGGATSGNVNVTPSSSTTYTLVCSNGSQATVNVTVSTAGLSVTANPATVRSGEASTITWSASNVTGCSIAGPGVSSSGLSGTTHTPALTSQSTYTLSCIASGGGAVSRAVTVGIVPRFQEQ